MQTKPKIRATRLPSSRCRLEWDLDTADMPKGSRETLRRRRARTLLSRQQDVVEGSVLEGSAGPLTYGAAHELRRALELALHRELNWALNQPNRS
jgi:hypothetical protein